MSPSEVRLPQPWSLTCSSRLRLASETDVRRCLPFEMGGHVPSSRRTLSYPAGFLLQPMPQESVSATGKPGLPARHCQHAPTLIMGHAGILELAPSVSFTSKQQAKER